MEEKIEKLSEMIRQSKSIAAFTGAGISTESGVPDFRSPGGIWSRFRPISFPEFLRSNQARMDYWARYLEFYPPFSQVRPNEGHMALVELERRGQLSGVITQNIDRLHQKAGHAEEKVIELHGRIDRTACLSCKATYDTADVIERVAGGETPPTCVTCGGWLKPATVSFGQDLPTKALESAVNLALAVDLFVAVGSSLTVHPAAALPGLARENGAQLVIINAETTAYDSYAHLVIHDNAGPTLSTAIRLLDRTE